MPRYKHHFHCNLVRSGSEQSFSVTPLQFFSSPDWLNPWASSRFLDRIFHRITKNHSYFECHVINIIFIAVLTQKFQLFKVFVWLTFDSDGGHFLGRFFIVLGVFFRFLTIKSTNSPPALFEYSYWSISWDSFLKNWFEKKNLYES